jgi:hypothetical protein
LPRISVAKPVRTKRAVTITLEFQFENDMVAGVDFGSFDFSFPPCGLQSWRHVFREIFVASSLQHNAINDSQFSK